MMSPTQSTYARLSSCRYPLLLISLFLFAGLVCGCKSKDEQKRPAADVPVKTVFVSQKDMPIEITTTGTVEAYSTVNICSRVDGQITKIHFNEGQGVQTGQVLFSIDDRPHQAALEAAKSNWMRDQVKAEKAEKDAARYAELVKKDYITQSQYEEALANAKALQAVVQADKAALETAKLNLSFCQITAPISGRTGSILVDEGNLVKANDAKPLVVINQIKPVFFKFSVPETYLPEIRRQLKDVSGIKVRVALSGKQNETREGRVTFMDNTVSPDTGAIELKATFDNTDQSLWPGQFLNVTIIMGTRVKALTVPARCIQTGQNGDFVFVVKPDFTVEPRPIVQSIRSQDEVVIEKGLATGEQVVVDGQLRLFPGAKVAIKTDTPKDGKKPQ